MDKYFGIRSGCLIKIDKIARLPWALSQTNLPHYFPNYQDAYNFVFRKSFATHHEKQLIRSHQLDLIIYTDGGQRNGNDGAWAYSINNDQSQLFRDDAYFNTKNNNYCELEAEIQSLRKIIKLHEYYRYIQLDTDSIAVKNITKNIRHGISIQSIARNTEWQISQLRRLKQILHRFSHLRIKKIKGHSGVIGNQLVHQMCSQAMSSIYPRNYDPFRIN